MGWLQYMLLGNFGQQMELNEQRSEVESLRAELRRSRDKGTDALQDTNRLKAEVDELRLYVAALTRLLVSNGSVDKGQLQGLIQEIDASDGESDNAYRGEIR